MEQYISKSALVAKIERLKADVLQKKEQCKRKGLEKILHQIGVYNKVLSLINTLEVKEVELEKPEDVRIRKNTIEIVRQSMNGVDVALPLSIYKECIAWLEKKDEKDNV